VTPDIGPRSWALGDEVEDIDGKELAETGRETIRSDGGE
jgi:hypothetical protein